MHRMPCHPGLPATGRHRHRPQPAWAQHHAVAHSWMERFYATIADQWDFETRPRSAAPRADASPVPLAHGGNPRRMPPHIAQRTPAACHAQRHARHKGTRRIHLRHAFPCSPPMIETLRRVRDAAIDGIMLRPCTLTVADDSRRATAPGQQGFPGVHLQHAFPHPPPLIDTLRHRRDAAADSATSRLGHRPATDDCRRGAASRQGRFPRHSSAAGVSSPATAERDSETPPRRGGDHASHRGTPSTGHTRHAFPAQPPVSGILRHIRDTPPPPSVCASQPARHHPIAQCHETPPRRCRP